MLALGGQELYNNWSIEEGIWILKGCVILGINKGTANLDKHISDGLLNRYEEFHMKPYVIDSYLTCIMIRKTITR